MVRKLVAVSSVGLFLVGCHTDMWTQAKVTAYDEDETGLFSDGTTARPIVPGTVARGFAQQDVAKATGYEGDHYTTKFPATLTIEGTQLQSSTEMAKILKRGQERFDIFCSHCHGAIGDGNGMITQRGLVLRRKPASYHTDRLRSMPIGHFFEVMTHGFGTMLSQKSRVAEDDRWAIVAYIRALQASQNKVKAELTSEDLKKIEEQNSHSAEPEGGH